MTTTYALSPLFKITRLDQEGRVVLHAGSGDERGHFAVDGAGAQPLIAWLLAVSPTGETALVDGVASAAGMDLEAGRAFVRSMIEAKVLVPEGSHVDAQQRIAEWGRFGWRDAADFHLATYGLRFIPDEVDGVSYEEYFSQMVDDVESAGEQPPAAAPRAGSLVGEAFAGPVTRRSSLDDVLAVAEPINRFDGARVRGDEFMPALRQAFGVQRTVGGMLGEHHLRSYPSGGARHPFEAYVVSKGLDDLPVGVYYFDPLTGGLVDTSDHGDAEQIDGACFGKGGILTAGAVVVLTCRWLRHSWKYRYDRSYRMLMLEVGHIVQAINMAMIEHGLNVYHCPSINDQALRQILAIDDDCAEGPVYALGLGHEGVR